MRVLVAEDDTSLLQNLGERLTKLGRTFVLVENAEELLKELGRNRFDLLITDNTMQTGMTGLEVVRKIRHDPFFKKIKNLPIVVQSGDYIEEEVLQLRASFLRKPWGTAELDKAIDAAVLQQTGSLIR